MHRVTGYLVQFLSDRFKDADDIADVSVAVLYAHVYDTAIVGNVVKLGVNPDSALTEFAADIPWKDYIGTAFICRLNHRIKLIHLRTHLIYP